MKKHILPLLCGFILAILLFILKYMLNISDDIFYKSFFAVIAVVIVGCIIFNIVCVLPIRKRVISHIKLLENGEPENALEEMKKLYTEMSDKKYLVNMKNICRLNMTAAYCDMEQYDSAMEILKELSSVKLMGNADFVYRLNLCACYFYMSDGKNGLRIYNENKVLFEKYENSEFYGGNVRVLKMFALLEEKRYTEAEKLLRQTVESSNNPRLEKDFDFIEKIIESHKNE